MVNTISITLVCAYRDIKSRSKMLGLDNEGL